MRYLPARVAARGLGSTFRVELIWCELGGAIAGTHAPNPLIHTGGLQGHATSRLSCFFPLASQNRLCQRRWHQFPSPKKLWVWRPIGPCA